MATYNFLDPSEENFENFEKQIEEISENRCCAYIGSGLSVDAFYPSWENLIKNLKSKAEEINKTDVVFPNDPKIDNPYYYPEDIEIIKSYLPEDDYWKIIFDLFGPKEKHTCVAFHIDLCLIPWVTLITTNYDFCLENASEYTPRKLTAQYYPELDISRLDKGHVFHIHGIIDPTNQRVSKFAVLSVGDYAKAYAEKSNLSRFLASLSEFHTLAFFGSGLRDTQVNKVIHEIQLEIDTRTKDEMMKGLGQRKPINNFIIYHPVSDNIELKTMNYLKFTPIILNKNLDRRYALYELLRVIKTRTTSLDFSGPRIHQGLLEV